MPQEFFTKIKEMIKGESMYKKRSVLLAIDGFNPTRDLFFYALDFCRSMSAKLQILQVIRPKEGMRALEKLGKKMVKAGAFFENAMMAVTFAEANDYTAASDIIAQAQKNLDPLLAEAKRSSRNICVNATTRLGNPEREILDYVEHHRDVVVTICDSGVRDELGEGEDVQGRAGNRRAALLIERIRPKLPVPLVVWRP